MQIVIATHNRKKLAELSRVLLPLGIEAVTGDGIGVTLTEAEETGSTFAENAFLKADLACRESGLPAVADDSGLCVDALDGAPGIYSARYAGEGATDEDRIRKMLTALADVPDEKRTAHFETAICCVFPNGDCVTASGVCRGVITREAHGSGGFGYDPIFSHDGVCFAQMSAEEKDAVSHRGNALRAFAEELKTYLSEKPGGNEEIL